jgi:hypothetical protein
MGKQPLATWPNMSGTFREAALQAVMAWVLLVFVHRFLWILTESDWSLPFFGCFSIFTVSFCFKAILFCGLILIFTDIFWDVRMAFLNFDWFSRASWEYNFLLYYIADSSKIRKMISVNREAIKLDDEVQSFHWNDFPSWICPRWPKQTLPSSQKLLRVIQQCGLTDQ